MKLKCLPVVLCFLLFLNDIQAQAVHTDSLAPDTLKSENNVVLKGENDYSFAVHDNAVIKLGLLDFVSGYIPVYYERKLLPWLSVQAGAGLTTRDFVADLVNEIFVPGATSNYGSSSYYQYTERKPLVGGYVSVQPKFYVTQDAINGFWLGPMLEFKRYNYKANEVAETTFSGGSDPVYLSNVYMHEYRNAVDFTFNTGWQWLLDNKVAVELYTGVGFRRFWEQRIDIEGNFNSTTGNATFVNDVRRYNGYRPDFNFALNLGGFF